MILHHKIIHAKFTQNENQCTMRTYTDTHHSVKYIQIMKCIILLAIDLTFDYSQLQSKNKRDYWSGTLYVSR